MTVREDCEVLDEQSQQLLSLADSHKTTGRDNNKTSSLTPCSGIDSQFYCRSRSRLSDDTRSEVVSDKTDVKIPNASSSHVKHEKPSRRHRLSTDVTTESSTDRKCNGYDVYYANYIHQRPVTNHVAGHGSGSTSHQSCRPPSESRLPRSTVDVDGVDDRLGQWMVNNGLAEYWSLLETEKVDLETLALLSDKDLRRLGIPLGPRRRLQRVVEQLQQQPRQNTPSSATACSSASDVTYL